MGNNKTLNTPLSEAIEMVLIQIFDLVLYSGEEINNLDIDVRTHSLDLHDDSFDCMLLSHHPVLSIASFSPFV